MTTSINPKHRVHIIAVDAAHFEGRKDGLCSYTLKTGDLIIARRHELEHTFDYRQVLPQSVLINDGKLWAYTRTEKGGEPGLHNMVAVSVGGHWDLEDMVLDNGVIDLAKSLVNATEREMREEVIIDANIISQRELPQVIAADDTDVDRRHMALVSIIELDSNKVESNEDELDSLGFLTPQELLSGEYKLETWARMICEMLVKEQQK